jgi:hypothetical protein
MQSLFDLWGYMIHSGDRVYFFGVIEIEARDPKVSVGYYSVSYVRNMNLELSEFPKTWAKCLAERKKMDGCDGGIADIAWMIQEIQKYGWILEPKVNTINYTVSV